MISGDRTIAAGKASAFSAMLETFQLSFERIDIICPQVSGKNGKGTMFFSNTVFVHPSPHGLWYQPFWIRKKGKELFNAFHHDVMTVHEYPPFYNGIGARLLKRIVNVPAALEIHHIIGWPVSANVTEKIGRILSRFFLPSHVIHFEAVRIVNATVKNILIDWGISKSLLHVVPSFYLDTSILKTNSTIKKSYDIVFCARLVANKGLLNLLQAVASISGVRLLIIGDGPLKPSALTMIHSLGLESRVTFAGWLPTPLDVANAMQSARLFVMPSLSEGGPRSALEAMACGLPVLVTEVGVMPDVIQDSVNGVFTTGSVVDLAEKIRRLLADENMLTALGKKAQNITQRFEKEHSLRVYADFLKNIARGSPS